MTIQSLHPSVPFRGFLVMARDEISGERGDGYLYPSPESLDDAQPLSCPNMPPSCGDPADCQGTSNAATHK